MQKKVSFLFVLAMLCPFTLSSQQSEPKNTVEIRNYIRNDSALSSLYSEFQLTNLHTQMDRDMLVFLLSNPLTSEALKRVSAAQDGFLNGFSTYKKSQNLQITQSLIDKLDKIAEGLTRNVRSTNADEESALKTLEDLLSSKNPNTHTIEDRGAYIEYLSQLDPAIKAVGEQLLKLVDDLQKEFKITQKTMYQLHSRVHEKNAIKLALVYRTFVRTAQHLGFSDEQIKNAEFYLEYGERNAFTVSGNSNKIIVVFYSGLLNPEDFSIAEIRAVIAHELGHIRAKHTVRRIVHEAMMQAYLIMMLSSDYGINLADSMNLKNKDIEISTNQTVEEIKKAFDSLEKLDLDIETIRNKTQDLRNTSLSEMLMRTQVNHIGHDHEVHDIEKAFASYAKTLNSGTNSIEEVYKTIVRSIVKLAIKNPNFIFTMYANYFDVIHRNLLDKIGNIPVTQYYRYLKESVQRSAQAFYDAQTKGEGSLLPEGFRSDKFMSFNQRLDSYISQENELTSDMYAAGLSRHLDVASTFAKLSGASYKKAHRNTILAAYENQAEEWLRSVPQEIRAVYMGSSHPAIVLRIHEIMNIDRFSTTVMANRFLNTVHFRNYLEAKIEVLETQIEQLKLAKEEMQKQNNSDAVTAIEQQAKNLTDQAVNLVRENENLSFEIYNLIFKRFDITKRNPRLLNLLQYELVKRQTLIENLNENMALQSQLQSTQNDLNSKILELTSEIQKNQKEVNVALQRANTNKLILVKKQLSSVDTSLAEIGEIIDAQNAALKPRSNQSFIGRVYKLIQNAKVRKMTPEMQLIKDAVDVLKNSTSIEDVVKMQFRIASRKASKIEDRPPTKLPIKYNGALVNSFSEFQSTVKAFSCIKLFN